MERGYLAYLLTAQRGVGQTVPPVDAAARLRVTTLEALRGIGTGAVGGSGIR